MADAFHEVRLPDKWSRGSAGGVWYSTTIIETAGGHEQRNVNWSRPCGRWDIAHNIKTPADMAELVAFFRNRQGRATGFRLKDWMDFAAEGADIGTGDGTTTEFQLQKAYSDGAFSVARQITKPVAGTVKVYLDGVEQASGWSVDTTTGVVTFDTAPAEDVAVTADFEFDVPVRFDVDLQEVSFDTIASRSWGPIPLLEIRT